MQVQTLPAAPLGPEQVARLLVVVLVEMGCDALALNVGHRAGVITDDAIEAAWLAGADVLAPYRSTEAVAL